MNRETIESAIKALISSLDAPTSDIGDWKIIKIYEARLKGKLDPYDYNKLAEARQNVRNEINRLQEELKKLEIE